MYDSTSNSSQSQNYLGERFHLVRFFSIGALVMLVIVAIALIYFEHQQSSLFKEVQNQQNSTFHQLQKKYSVLQEELAKRDLMTIHESGNENLTRLFANSLWNSDFAPFAARASKLPVQTCQELPLIEKDGKSTNSPQRQACYDNLGEQIMAVDGFTELDKRVFRSMKNSSVLKIKVFDTRGITIYSSDHNQIGDDKASTHGWKSAIKGDASSGFSHRSKFDTFEGTLSNREVISSYLPVYQPDTNEIVGVFEVYADVTKFFNTIKSTSELIKSVTSENQNLLKNASLVNQVKVDQASLYAITAILIILTVLFGGLFLIVLKADKTIDQQLNDKEEAQQQLVQTEKMASLGEMVAGVAHQLNTPIAYSYNNVNMVKEELECLKPPLELAKKFARIVSKTDSDKISIDIGKWRSFIKKVSKVNTDTAILQDMLSDIVLGLDQMRELVENLLDFTRLDKTKITHFDLAVGLKNVVYMARSVISDEIDIVEDYYDLPEIICNPTKLNQVFMNLVNNAAQSINGAGTITIKCFEDDDIVNIEISDTGTGILDEDVDHIFDNYYSTKPHNKGTGIGLPIAKRIVQDHGGTINFKTKVGVGTTFVVQFPRHVPIDNVA